MPHPGIVPPVSVRIGLGPAGIPAMRRIADRDRFVAFVRRAEELGYASVCVGDHLDDRGAPLLLLTAAAMETRRLTLATHVLCNELRNAAVVAQDARTLQAISGGRLELGLGTGWLESDFEAAGIEMQPFRDRLTRLEAAIARIRELSANPDVAVPPIVMGGGGREMLAASARLADIVTLNIPLGSGAGLASNTIASGTRASFDERVRLVGDRATASGRTVALHVYVHAVHTGDGWRDAASDAADLLELPFEAYVGSPHVLAGDVDQIVSTVSARRDELGIGYFSVPATSLDEFAPVVARLEDPPS
jgi:probable F420-dependent oxidoreductase